MEDLAAAQLHHRIHQPAQGALITAQQLGIQQGRQQIKAGLVGFGRFPLNDQIRFADFQQLIQPPNGAPGPKGRGSGAPTQQPMAGGMHPGLMAHAQINPGTIPHPGAQEAADQ